MPIKELIPWTFRHWSAPSPPAGIAHLAHGEQVTQVTSELRDTTLVLVRYARFQVAGQAHWGRVEQTSHGEQIVQLSGAPWHHEPRSSGRRHSLDAVRLLSPAQPSKIVAVGRNYADHATEMGSTRPEAPRIFFKPPTGIIGPGEHIVLPPTSLSAEIHYEAELAVVIGNPCRQVQPEAVTAVIFGYTCANDVTARDIQRRDGQPSYAKSFDTFCPIGP